VTWQLGRGGSIGVVGSGQLGMFFAQAAHRLGIPVQVLSPEAESPAGHVADREVVGDLQDAATILRFAEEVQLLTYETEAIAAEGLAAASAITVVRPAASVPLITRDRVLQRALLAQASVPSVPWEAVLDDGGLARAVRRLGTPGILKRARGGYDGRGQVRISNAAEASAAWHWLGSVPCAYEAFINFAAEFSVIVARSEDGAIASYAPFENTHRDGILETTTWPARIPEAATAEGMRSAAQLAQALGHIGTLCVEYFLTADGRVLVNEVAARTHNSGHLTMEAAEASQFEQHLRAITGRPLGSTAIRQPAAMLNIIGRAANLEAPGLPAWPPDTVLHWYGKQPRPARKVGHITATAASPEEALARVRAAEALTLT
jgi:5-(carboxyamino)imidazole ribonucleotide synthase